MSRRAAFLCFTAAHLVLTVLAYAAAVILLGQALDGSRLGVISDGAVLFSRVLSFPIAWPLGKYLAVHGLLGNYPLLLNSAFWGYLALKCFDWMRLH